MSRKWDPDVLNLKRAFVALWKSNPQAREAALRWLWECHEADKAKKQARAHAALSAVKP